MSLWGIPKLDFLKTHLWSAISLVLKPLRWSENADREAGAAGWVVGEGFSSKSEIATMPFKANAARRHHIPKQTRKVTNRGSLQRELASAR
jgi:hypothetical protein